MFKLNRQVVRNPSTSNLSANDRERYALAQFKLARPNVRMFIWLPQVNLQTFRPVHYSPSSRSALAEAELTYRDDHKSQSVYVYFKLNVPTRNALIQECARGADVKLLVWTDYSVDLIGQHGLLKQLCGTYIYTLYLRFQAVAVHPSVIYSMLRRRSDSGVVIVAQDRVEALADIIGDSEELMTFKGKRGFLKLWLDIRNDVIIIGSELVDCTLRTAIYLRAAEKMHRTELSRLPMLLQIQELGWSTAHLHMAPKTTLLFAPLDSSMLRPRMRLFVMSTNKVASLIRFGTSLGIK